MLETDVLFDALAEDYETMRQTLGWDPFEHIKVAFSGYDFRGKRILDAGCGTGECTRWFKAQGAVPVGIDISGEMCFQAAERSENIMYMQHDLNERLPFDDANFDGVVALGCLEYLPDIERSVKDIFRVMKPGGIFLGCFERFGEDCPGGCAAQVTFLDDWVRYRQSREVLEGLFSSVASDFRMDEVCGFILEETHERTRYLRVIAIK